LPKNDTAAPPRTEQDPQPSVLWGTGNGGPTGHFALQRSSGYRRLAAPFFRAIGAVAGRANAWN